MEAADKSRLLVLITRSATCVIVFGALAMGATAFLVLSTLLVIVMLVALPKEPKLTSPLPKEQPSSRQKMLMTVGAAVVAIGLIVLLFRTRGTSAGVWFDLLVVGLVAFFPILLGIRLAVYAVVWRKARRTIASGLDEPFVQIKRISDVPSELRATVDELGDCGFKLRGLWTVWESIRVVFMSRPIDGVQAQVSTPTTSQPQGITLTTHFAGRTAILSTQSSGYMSASDQEIRQVLPDADVASMVRHHEEAVALVTQHGVMPDRLSPDESVDAWVEEYRQMGARMIAAPMWAGLELSNRMLKGEHLDVGPLTEDAETPARIEGLLERARAAAAPTSLESLTAAQA